MPRRAPNIRHSARRWLLCASVALPFAASLLPARAADVSTGQAMALQGALQEWLRNSLGGLAVLPPDTVRLTPQGDHFGVAIATGAGNPDITATATPGENGLWRIDSIQLPPVASYSMTLPALPARPAPRRPNAGPGARTAPAPVARGPRVMRIATKITDQSAHALFDPALGIPTELAAQYHGVRVEVTSDDQHQVQHYDTYTIGFSAKPTVPGAATPSAPTGTVDVAQQVDVDGVTLDAGLPDGTQLRMTAAHMRNAAHAVALSTQKAFASLQAMHAVSTAMSGAIGGNGKPNPKALEAMDRTPLRQMVVALQNVVAGFDVTQTMDDMRIESGGAGFSLAHMRMGMAAAAPTDLLDLHLDVGMDGLASPSLPPDMADLVPRRIAFQPVLSGLSMHDLTQMAMTATDKQADMTDLVLQLGGLFAHGGIGVGIENIAADIGPASITGEGHVKLLGLSRNSGTGRLRATGLDALIDKVKALPDAAEAVPVLTMIRQMGRPDGDALVWDLSLENSHLLVNGVDLSSLGSAKKL